MTAFMLVALFGVAVFYHGSERHMPTACPFSPAEVAPCPEDIVARDFHHISAYHSFLNVPTYGSFINIIILIFLALSFLVASARYVPLLHIFISSGKFDDIPPDISTKKKFFKWLSLFENSPSFV